MKTGPSGSVMLVKEVHPKKAPQAISARLGGSVISLKDVHPRKAYRVLWNLGEVWRQRDSAQGRTARNAHQNAPAFLNHGDSD